MAETDKKSYYKGEWLEEYLDSEGAFYNRNESDEFQMQIMNSSSYRRVLPIVAIK